MKVKKQRLDKLMVERGLCESRTKAQALILAGQVVVNDTRIDKAGTSIPEDANIRLKGKLLQYVSRGGLKLEAALDNFALSPEGIKALDLGASTGGFTDLLLQRGATQVYAVDVGYGQLHPKLRNDERVVNLERTNARHLDPFVLGLEEEELFDWIVGDLSFISVRHVLPPMQALLKEGGEVVILVKPQFEAGREQVGKGGVVREDAIRKECADNVASEAAKFGFVEINRMDCPVHGPKGNIEILLWLRKQSSSVGRLSESPSAE